MESKCAYHPEAPSTTVCAECGKPICEQCRQDVAGKPVCNSCVEQIRARVASSIHTAAQPRAPQPLPPAVPLDPARLLVGIVAAVIAGAIGAFVWDKFVIITNIQFGLIASGIGWAVGVAMVVGSGGQHGIVPAIIGAVLAFCAMMFGEYLLRLDAVGSAFHMSVGIGKIPISKLFEAMPLEVIDWVFIAIGVYGGFQVPMGTRRQQ